MSTIAIKFIDADGLKVSYREAGPKDAPVILLLHGFPSSSHQYRNIIPLLSTKYHVIAPDLPGFGFTEVLESRKYTYTFENLTLSMEAFLNTLKIKKYSVYVFEYGAPTGFRRALRQPASIQSVITQNGNAYEEGLSDFWDPLRQLWATDSSKIREKIRAGLLNLEGTKSFYIEGSKSDIAPEAYWLDYALLSRPGNQDIQLDLFYDYRNIVKLYPQFHERFRKSQVPSGGMGKE